MDAKVWQHFVTLSMTTLKQVDLLCLKDFHAFFFPQMTPGLQLMFQSENVWDFKWTWRCALDQNLFVLAIPILRQLFYRWFYICFQNLLIFD